MNSSGYQQYTANDAATASPERLLVRAYDGMVRFLGLAEEAILQHDYNLQNHYIQRTQSILGVLSANLESAHNEALGASLSSLYEWFSLRLIEANLKGDAEAVGDVRLRIADLRDAWSQAAQQMHLSHSGGEAGIEEAA
ncbi:MAG: flagellar export chaperone FliS [Armatimonadetes bacterium]|nr:flagellar export chaperone FliS [Armatimonadota bacterium]